MSSMIVKRASPLVRIDVGELALLVVERRVEQQVGHADDRVHRRADLMAHRGEEGALGLGRRVGRLASSLELRGPLGDLHLEVVDQ